MPELTSNKSAKGNGKPNWQLVLIPVIVIAIVAGVFFFRSNPTQNPTFPLLSETPDSSLRGTVAYYDNPSRCIKAVSASGAKSKTVMCMEDFDAAKAQKEGKPVGWNITWLPDNRLEITEFLMLTTGSTPTFKPSWQKVIDVITGAIQETPSAQIPQLPTSGARTTVSPEGSKISFTSDSGHGVVTLTDKAGKVQVLLDVKGDPETYRLNSAHWSPDFKWVAVDDGHLLITTITDPIQTRTLTPPLETDYGYDALHWFDITAADLLN